MNRRGLYFEDFSAGQQYTTDRRTITEADHINFTTSFGFFEPLFMDRAYVADATPYKRPIVPGALTFSMAEGLTILSGILHGTGLAFLGVDLKVIRPVFYRQNHPCRNRRGGQTTDPKTGSGHRLIFSSGEQSG